MKKSNLKKNLPVILVLSLFVIVVIASFIGRYYEQKVEDFNQEIFETYEGGYFTLFLSKRPVEYEDLTKQGYMMAGLRPGEAFEGELGIKNHDDISHEFSLNVNNLMKFENGEFVQVEDGELFLDVVIPDSGFVLEPDEVIFFDYSMSVPEDLPLGTYRASIAAKAVDADAQSMNQNGIVLYVAVAVNLEVEVSDNPPVYEYMFLSDYAEGFSRNFIIFKGRYFVASLLGILTLFFIYLAWMDSKKKK